MGVLLPAYAEDLNYPAYQDRLLIKSLCQPGVVGPEDFKVSATIGGFQANVKPGLALVAQTKALQEAENPFFNGMYQVPLSIESNPSNSVIVSNANPTIAQVILRVYDVGELKIGGSSSAKLEWLNGTPTIGATLANRSGAAELPQSSLRLADVLVPKEAENSLSFTFRDRRPWARGFNYFLKRTAGNIKVESGTVAYIDQSGLAIRAECTGNPFKFTLIGNMELNTEAAAITLGFRMDGVKMDETADGNEWIVGGLRTNPGLPFFNVSHQFIPPPGPGDTKLGSHLFQPVYVGTGAGTNNIYSTKARPIIFIVQEIFQGNANNGVE